MKTHLKAFLAGFGTVIAIYPSTSYSNLLPRSDEETRIRNAWEKTGEQLRFAINEYNDNINVTKQKSSKQRQESRAR